MAQPTQWVPATLDYHMAGNFRGGSHEIFHPRKLMPTVLWYKSIVMGVITNMAARPTLSVLASNSSHCHRADSVFFPRKLDPTKLTRHTVYEEGEVEHINVFSLAS